MWIDSHCHPDSKEFEADRDGIMERARLAGVDGVVAIGGGAAPGTLDVAIITARNLRQASTPVIWATAGVHPHEAVDATEESWKELEGIASLPEVIAIGEIGLDYYYDHSPREAQRDALGRQLKIAASAGLPVSIHCRDAWEECFSAIASVSPPALGVFHCFTGTRDWAERILDMGWYLSFSGMLTFKNASELRRVAAWAPEDRILIETDAPFLAPVPHRGRRNEPAWVAETAAVLTQLRGWSPEKTAEQTRTNFFRLFPRASHRVHS